MLVGKIMFLMDFQWKTAMDAKNISNVNDEHSLGKGEVERSIRSGSTTNEHLYWTFESWPFCYSAVSGRTIREQDIASSGVSVDSVHGAFTGGTTMDLSLEATRRDLMKAHRKETDPHEREVLNVMIQNLNLMIKDPNDEAVRVQFRKNYARWVKSREQRG